MSTTRAGGRLPKSRVHCTYLPGTPRDDPNARQAWIDFGADAATTGVVRRLRLMSIESDMLPDPKIPHGADWGWATRQFVPGSERFYELARAPRALRSYQPDRS